MRIVSLSDDVEAVEITASLLNELPPPGYTYIFPVPGMGLTSLRSGSRGISLFRGYLQKLIEEWFRCGKKILPEGATVRGSGMGLPAENSSFEWTLTLVPTPVIKDGKRVGDHTLDRTDPAFNSWLWRVYWDYLHREKPNVWFTPDGEVLFNYHTPVYGKPEPFVALPPFLDADSPNLGCWAEAVLWFILLLNSGYAQRLDRCAYCERYFVRKREPKKGYVYKRDGANCGNCRGESSKNRTETIRKQAKETMLGVAAKAWATYKQSHRTPNRYAEVARRVTARCRSEIQTTTRRDKVETRWVKRNEKEIERRAAQLNAKDGAKRNAKG